MMESNNFKNTANYLFHMNDHNRVEIDVNSRLPSWTCAIHDDSEQGLFQRQGIKIVDIGNNELISKITSYQAKKIRELEHMNEKLKQQLSMESNLDVGEIMFQKSHTANTMERRFAALEQQVQSLSKGYDEDRSLKHMLINSISKMEVYWGEIRERLGRIEENLPKGWNVDVYDYGEPGTLEQELHRNPSPLYCRRDYDPGAVNSMTINIPGNGSNIQSTTSFNDRTFENADAGLPEMSGCTYASTYAGDLITSPCSDPSYMSASMTRDRRQSDSATNNTIESGYCEDREEIMDGDQASVHHDGYVDQEVTYDAVLNTEDDTEQRQTVNVGIDANASRNVGGHYSTSAVIMMSGQDGDIEFIGEFQTQKNSGSTLQNSSVIQQQPSNSDPVALKESPPMLSLPTSGSTGNTQRASVFSRLTGETQPNAQLFGMDFEDNAYGGEAANTQERPQTPLEPDISNVNSIFEISTGGNVSECDENCTVIIGNSTTPQKRKKDTASSNGQPKRIRGILKAPVKQELGTPSSLFKGSSQGIANHLVVSPSNLLDSLNLTNIKKERVAHAVDGVDGETNAWKCICGHQTNTPSGLRTHVKQMGTEEPRFKCPWVGCDGRFIYPYHVRDHLKKDHNDETVPRKVHGCEKCYKIFYDRNTFRHHTNDRNEICKLTSRRRSNHAKAIPFAAQPESVASTESPVESVITETPKRPSFIITL